MWIGISLNTVRKEIILKLCFFATIFKLLRENKFTCSIPSKQFDFWWSIEFAKEFELGVWKKKTPPSLKSKEKEWSIRMVIN